MAGPITIPMLYMSHKEDRRPRIGIYYIFRDYGVCREFQLDVAEFVTNRKKVFWPLYQYEFTDEEEVLNGLARNRLQAIKTNICEKLSFQFMTQLVASFHFNEFASRYKWLC